jgi:hypothetical protein
MWICLAYRPQKKYEQNWTISIGLMVFWKKGGLVAKNDELQKEKRYRSMMKQGGLFCFVSFCFVMITSPKTWHFMLRSWYLWKALDE